MSKRTANNNSFLHDSISTPTLNKENLIVNDTLQIDDFENLSANVSLNPLNHNVSECDSDLKVLEELNGTIKSQGDIENGDDTDIIEMRCNSMFAKEEIDFLNSPVRIIYTNSTILLNSKILIYVNSHNKIINLTRKKLC